MCGLKENAESIAKYCSSMTSLTFGTRNAQALSFVLLKCGKQLVALHTFVDYESAELIASCPNLRELVIDYWPKALEILLPVVG